MARFLQGMFEYISNELLDHGNRFLSYQFYILSGRFSIQYILDTYLDAFLDQAQFEVKGVAAILTACLRKLIE